MNPTLNSALAKLRWGAEQKDWSVDLSPTECATLLAELRKRPIPTTTPRKARGGRR